jgi:hypothetical protein
MKTSRRVTEEGRHHEVRIDDSVQVSDSISVDVGRGLEGIRLAVLGIIVSGIIVSIGLAAAALPEVWWVRIVPLGAQRTLRVVGIRDDDADQPPRLVVEDVEVDAG